MTSEYDGTEKMVGVYVCPRCSTPVEADANLIEGWDCPNCSEIVDRDNVDCMDFLGPKEG